MNRPGLETIDHRHLGAIRFLNATTGTEVKRLLDIKTHDLKLFRNLSKKWVIAAARGLESHRHEFVTPPAPPPDGSGAEFFSHTYELVISDPDGEFLTRKASIKLPRRLRPHETDNIFNPVDIALYPTSTISVAPNWNVVRVSIQDAAIIGQPAAIEEVNGIRMQKRLPVAGAWLRLIKAGDSQPSQHAISDKRGEAVILIPGLPVINFSSPDEAPAADDPEEHNEHLASGPVLQVTTRFNIEVVVNPESIWPVDPVEMEKHAADGDWLPAVQWRDGKTVRDDPDSAPRTSPVELILEAGEKQTLELYVTLANTA